MEGFIVNDDELLKVMLTKFKVKTETKKGQKFILYGELAIKFDLLIPKKDKIYVHYKNESIAIIK